MIFEEVKKIPVMIFMNKKRKGRRPYSISVGQRPMKSGQSHQSKAESLEAVLFSGFRPFRAWIYTCSHFIGRCPMLLLKGFQPYLRLQVIFFSCLSIIVLIIITFKTEHYV